MMHSILFDIYETDRFLFPPTIHDNEDIIEFYRSFRTFRKTSDTRAIEKQVSSEDIDLVNKWDLSSLFLNKRVSQSMRHHYAEFELLLKPFLRYTKAM